MLAALEDLRAEAAVVVLPLMRSWPAVHRTAAVRVLRFARGPEVVTTLIAWVRQWVQPERRARRSPRAPAGEAVGAGGRPDMPPSCGVCGQPAAETEAFLRTASGDWDPTVRAAAVGSLGWWEPTDGIATSGGVAPVPD